MRRLSIAEAPLVVLALHDEIRRSKNARYDHRLHAILLVAQGIPCPEVAYCLGDAPRTIQLWVHRFEEQGLSGLMDRFRTGRPQRLSPEQLMVVDKALRSTPAEYSLNGHLWDGKTNSARRSITDQELFTFVTDDIEEKIYTNIPVLPGHRKHSGASPPICIFPINRAISTYFCLYFQQKGGIMRFKSSFSSFSLKMIRYIENQ